MIFFILTDFVGNFAELFEYTQFNTSYNEMSKHAYMDGSGFHV